MAEFVLFVIPAVVYLVVQSRKPDRTLRWAADKVGARWGDRTAYGWAALLLPALVLVAWLAIVLIPADALDTPGVTIARVTSAGAVVGVVLRALGEEIFFRGLIAGSLIRRLGFAKGNLLQALIFLVPHLLLLVIDVRLWPIIPVQFAAGWLLGWLRHKADSFVPGAIVHAAANLLAGFIAA